MSKEPIELKFELSQDEWDYIKEHGSMRTIYHDYDMDKNPWELKQTYHITIEFDNDGYFW